MKQFLLTMAGVVAGLTLFFVGLPVLFVVMALSASRPVPSASVLDLDLRRSMCEDVIGVLRGTGTTAILVTHDPGEAFAVSDQLAVMQGGVIMQCAHPETVYWQPASPAVPSRITAVIRQVRRKRARMGAVELSWAARCRRTRQL